MTTDGSAMDRLSEKYILDWEEQDVHLFLNSLGFSQFQDRIVEDRITGDILVLFDMETLKDFGLSIGQRLTVLKGIYQVKQAYGIEISEGDWVPPSEIVSSTFDVDLHRDSKDYDPRESVLSYTDEDLDSLTQAIHNQADRIERLESDNNRLTQMLTSLMEDFATFRNEQQADTTVPSISQPPPPSTIHPLGRKHSFKWGSLSGPTGKAQLSPTKSAVIEIATPAASPTFPPGPTNGHATPPRKQSNPGEPARVTPPPQVPSQPRAPLSSSRQDSTDNLKSFKVSLEDPTWKVLPAALKKYKINNDNWQNYAMFICYGSTGNRIERCLSYDEKPLLLFQKLKDAKKNPVFMLKHIKDIRSPIVVAQQKHAARTAHSIASSDGHVGGPPTSSASSDKPKARRPPKLEVHDLSIPPAGPESSVPSALPTIHTLAPASALLTSHTFLNTATTGTSPSTGWPQHELSSPASEHPPGGSFTGASHTLSASTKGNPSITRELPPASATSQVSYAVAIYPYMAEQEDEFDVVVGDTFIILSRARGWWVVQRDSDGTGHVNEGTGAEGEVLQGWVPAGCLLETNVPVASAIAEAEGVKSSSGFSSKQNGPGGTSPILEEPDTPRDADGPDEGTEDGGLVNGAPSTRSKSKTPILPLSIISTSFPGIALMEYRKKGDEELDLEKDDKLRVFKRYNHWSYAVKESGGDRGWVPSWFIGKVSKDPKDPSNQTSERGTSNSTSGGLLISTPQLDDAQVSPMSSAFPTAGATTTTIGRI